MTALHNYYNSLKKLTIAHADKDAEQLELSYIAK